MSARWLARSSFVLLFAAAVVMIGFAELAGVVMIIIGVVGACLVAAGAYWFLAHRGVVRWLALGLVVLAPAGVLVIFAMNGLVWVAVVSVALIVAAVAAARLALVPPATGDQGMPVREVPPPRHAFLSMNPRSGGGKVARFGLKERAEALGAEVVLLEGPGQVDVAALARGAVAAGADLLGVAGGDGTQALVAGIAAEHDLPFLVVSAGTRNHFAMDLGLDRDNPAACLDALTGDGVEQRIDLGVIGGRTFVNNASFGAYAEVVESPAYRDDKRGTTLETLPDLLSGHRGAKLTARAGDVTITGPQALLVSNDPYGRTDIAGLSRRARLDAGTLGVVAVTVNSALQAATLLRGARGQGLTVLTAGEVVVEADAPEIPVGIDGETVMMATPVHCAIRPKALRVRVPRDRPGIRPPKPELDWPTLRRLASFRATPAVTVSADEAGRAITPGGETGRRLPVADLSPRLGSLYGEPARAINRPLTAHPWPNLPYPSVPIRAPSVPHPFCEDLLYIQLQGHAPRAGPELAAVNAKAPRDGGADWVTAQHRPKLVGSQGDRGAPGHVGAGAHSPPRPTAPAVRRYVSSGTRDCKLRPSLRRPIVKPCKIAGKGTPAARRVLAQARTPARESWQGFIRRQSEGWPGPSVAGVCSWIL